MSADNVYNRAILLASKHTKMRKIAYLVISDNSIPVFRGMPSYRARADEVNQTAVSDDDSS